jgi:hypothetical protein
MVHMLTSLIKEHPKTTLAVIACGLAWVVKPSVVVLARQRVLGGAIRLGFDVLEGGEVARIVNSKPDLHVP